MYEVDELKQKILHGTMISRMSQGSSYPLHLLKRMTTFSKDMDRIRTNLFKVSDKELLFLRLSLVEGLQDYIAEEAIQRRKFYKHVQKIDKIMDEISKPNVESVDIMDIASSTNTEPVLVSYIEDSFKRNTPPLNEERYHDNLIRARKLSFLNPNSTAYEFSVLLEQQIDLSITDLIIANKRYLEEQKKKDREKVSERTQIKKIEEEFLRLHTQLESEDLIYELAQEFNLTPGKIKEVLDELQ